MSEERPLVYTEVDSKWATPADRVRLIRFMWRVIASYEGAEYREARFKMRLIAVKHFFRPRARVSAYVWSGGKR